MRNKLTREQLIARKDKIARLKEQQIVVKIPTKQELLKHYQRHTTVVNGTEIHYNIDYGITYSLKAIRYIELHEDDVAIQHTLHDRQRAYCDPDLTFHQVIAYEAVYKLPMDTHTCQCTKCGCTFNYEDVPKRYIYDDPQHYGELAIPTICPECSED